MVFKSAICQSDIVIENNALYFQHSGFMPKIFEEKVNVVQKKTNTDLHQLGKWFASLVLMSKLSPCERSE